MKIGKIGVMENCDVTPDFSDTGSEGIPFGKNMQALPVSALWKLGALKNTK